MTFFRAGMWFALPQIISRLTSFAVFALIANNVSAGALGSFALASAFTSGAVALAPALVGKPLSVRRASGSLADDPEDAHAGAVFVALLISVALLLSSLFVSAEFELALVFGALGLVSAMFLEGSFWRLSFTRGARSAALMLAAAYGAQLLIVLVVDIALPAALLPGSPFVGILIVAIAAYSYCPIRRPRGALDWCFKRFRLWLPYMVASGSSLAVALAIPTVLAVTVSLSATATYRAAELAFGGVNLAIGIVTQVLLTRETTSPAKACRPFSIAIALLAVATLCNAAILWVLPDVILDSLFGSVAAGLLAILSIFAVQRACLAAASVASTVLVPYMPGRSYGLMSSATSASTIVALVIGGVLSGFPGAVVGLTVAEFLTAFLFGAMLWRRLSR